ncbi:hypothetical protein R5W23_004149 [Gemmata sp. JC673]|uniref:Transposase n=1 Tax=Gemmata algarum TaxID=2975278 RepID=A0ABU5F508_9BACT|nr:hypothetical protein [Gemmata algarum]MDY3562675.1 hypothetical protein [Gemmata algarum]
MPEHATPARHLWNHFEQWFAFDPRTEPTNGKAGRRSARRL